MLWLLSEAQRERRLKFLQSSEVICLLRDERQKRLLVRFRAARWHQGKVEVMSGLLWQMKGFGSGAAAIAQATEGAMRCAAGGADRAPPWCKPKAYEKCIAASTVPRNLQSKVKALMRKIEAVTVDSTLS